MEATKMTKWQSQLNYGMGKFTGGTGGVDDVNVSAVPVDLVLTFTVSDTVTPAVTVVVSNGQERWYKGGRAWTPTFPQAYTLADGSTLTIDRNSPAVGDLILTQD